MTLAEDSARRGGGGEVSEGACEASILHGLAERVVEGARAKALLLPKLMTAIQAKMSKAFYAGCCRDFRLMEEGGTELRFQASLYPASREDRSAGRRDPVVDMITAAGWTDEAAAYGRWPTDAARFLSSKLAQMFGWRNVIIVNYPPTMSYLNFSVDLERL